MEIELTKKAAVDLDFWKKTGNDTILKRIRELTSAIIENPYLGIGKPEALKYNLSGKWSRRINKIDRIVYEVRDNKLFISSLKGHYNKT